MFAHFSRNMRRYDVTIFQLNTKSRIGQGLGNHAFHLKCFFFRQCPVISGC